MFFILGVWVRKGSQIKIEVLPCKESDCVCEKLRDWPYFYLYSCLLTKLGVRLLFSNFQCGVMFVKIRSALDEFSFHLNEFLEEIFSLSWSPEPMQILDVKDRCTNDNLVKEFLIFEMESKELLYVANC
ncbi:hypothetical protein S245_055327 [Arachis hypogaea]